MDFVHCCDRGSGFLDRVFALRQNYKYTEEYCNEIEICGYIFMVSFYNWTVVHVQMDAVLLRFFIRS